MSCCSWLTDSAVWLQIFGFDILLDDKFRAWLIEVNTGPDLSSRSPLDKQLKHKMVAQMLHLVGVIPYDRCVTCAPGLFAARVVQYSLWCMVKGRRFKSVECMLHNWNRHVCCTQKVQLIWQTCKQGCLHLLLTCFAVQCSAVLCCAGNRATDAYRDEYIAQQKLEQTARLTGLPVSRSTSLAGSGRTMSSSGRALVSCGSTLSSCGSLVGSRPQTVATSQAQLGMRRSADWLPATAAAAASASGKHVVRNTCCLITKLDAALTKATMSAFPC